MKKLSLKVESLAVESFEAGAAAYPVGTVQGRAYTPGCDSIQICKLTVVGSDEGVTCQLECTGSCGYTYCAGDCTHGQTNGATCACATAISCPGDC